MPNFAHPDLNKTIDSVASLKVKTAEAYLNSLAQTSIANVEGLSKFSAEQSSDINGSIAPVIAGVAAASLKVAELGSENVVPAYRQTKQAMLNAFKDLCSIPPSAK